MAGVSLLDAQLQQYRVRRVLQTWMLQIGISVDLALFPSKPAFPVSPLVKPTFVD